MVGISARSRTAPNCPSVSIWVLLLTNVLVFQLGWNARGGGSDEAFDLLAMSAIGTTTTQVTAKPGETSLSTSIDYALAPRQGEAEALPSIRVAKEEFKSQELYGGKGDKSHLGGWTDLDHHGVSPAAWKWIVTEVGVHSVIDVGCGRGISTSWFYFHGVEVRCVEGSHDAVENTVLPDPRMIVEHDFSRGPWWPAKTYDAVWCVEFLEHVGRNYRNNYIEVFRKAAFIFATASNWGGHHHVEVHDEEWWITKFSMLGFVHSKELTAKLRAAAHNERGAGGFAPNGMELNAQHIWLNMKVFINPAVASLPQHAHLLAEPGCFLKRENGHRLNRECGTGNKKAEETETVLPEEFRALNLLPAQDDKWFNHIKARVTQKEPEKKDTK